MGFARIPLNSPDGKQISQGRDAGPRFLDIDTDRHGDAVFSNAQRYAAYAYTSLSEAWSRRLMDALRNQGHPLPMIVREDCTNNGAWFSYRQMWVQNEDTGGTLLDHVDRRHMVNGFLLDRQGNVRKPRGGTAAPGRHGVFESVLTRLVVFRAVDSVMGKLATNDRFLSFPCNQVAPHQTVIFLNFLISISQILLSKQSNLTICRKLSTKTLLNLPILRADGVKFSWR